MSDFKLVKGRYIIMKQLYVTVENIEQSGLTENDLAYFLNSVNRVFENLKYFNTCNKDFHCTSIEIDKQRILYITSGEYGIKAFVVDEKQHTIDLMLNVRSLKMLSLNENKIVNHLATDRACPYMEQDIEKVHKLTNDLYADIDSRGPPESVEFHDEKFEVDFELGDE